MNGEVICRLCTALSFENGLGRSLALRISFGRA